MALVAARGPDTVDCGAIESWDEAGAGRLGAGVRAGGPQPGARVPRGDQQAVADGADVIGWVGGPDGGGWRLHYTAVFGMYLGGDSECVDWQACGAVRDRCPACGTLEQDLCLACE